MNDEIQNNNLSNFQEYLIKNGYSKHVIPMYIRKVKEFLVYNNDFSIIRMDYEKIKKTISEYIASISLSSQKDMIQAALHTYYYFISGNQFTRRLYSKDFTMDMLIEAEIERFRKYLSNVARLSSNTIISQCNSVKIFLYCSFPERDFSPEKVIADHVRIYFTHTLSHVSPTSKKTIIVRIRSYLRFLEFTDGFQSEEILKLPMTSPVWKRAGIPKHLTDTEINNLFSTYNRTNPTGIRNYSIARCLKDLGLRCSEVARLSLDDFDWIEGTITITKTKSHSERILPLHKITGKSIEAYLVNSRPMTAERILFVRFKNKQGYPMGTSQVRNTVRIAATKAGLENFTGTHMLRHTAAKEMINSGVDLKTIADVLGHESIETTRIYTKLDFTQLLDVAGIWPEVGYEQ